MKLISIFFLVTVIPSFGGTVTLPVFGTDWSKDDDPGQSQVTSNDDFTVNLDDRAGLIAGLPIQITVSSPDQFLWVGGFHLDGGFTAISSTAKLSLLLGGESAEVSADLLEDFGDLGDLSNEGNVSDPVGYVTGPVLPELVLTVPWGTGLTNAVFTFSQDSEITGAGNVFNFSGVYLSGGTAAGQSSIAFSLQSVPEPSSV